VSFIHSIHRDRPPHRLLGIVIDLNGAQATGVSAYPGAETGAIGTLAGGMAHNFNNILMGSRDTFP
jgi:hypothetical protein